MATSSTTFDFSALEMAVKVLDAACGAAPTFYIVPNKGFIQLSATLNGSTACFRIPGAVDGLTTAIEVPKDLVLQAAKGRKEGSIAFKNSVLLIKSGSYTADINVVDVETDAVPDVPTPAASDDTTSFTLTPTLAASLATVLPNLRIDKMFQTAPDIMVALRVKGQSVWAATYDDNQLCFQKHKAEEAVGDFNISVPYLRLQSFIKDLPTSGAKVHVNQDTITAITKAFRVSIALPALDPDSLISPDSVYEKAQSVAKASGASISVARDDLQALVENARALVATGSDVRFEPAKKGTLVTISSPRGKVKQTVKTDGQTEPFGVGYLFMQTLMQKQPGKKVEQDVPATIDFEVCSNTFVICRSNVTYLALLSANESEA